LGQGDDLHASKGLALAPVALGVLVKSGQGRGTRYALSRALEGTGG